MITIIGVKWRTFAYFDSKSIERVCLTETGNVPKINREDPHDLSSRPPEQTETREAIGVYISSMKNQSFDWVNMYSVVACVRATPKTEGFRKEIDDRRVKGRRVGGGTYVPFGLRRVEDDE